MADEAKNEATFIVEPLGSNLDSPTSYQLRKRFQATDTTTNYSTANVSKMFDDIMDQMSRPTASNSSMKGGLLFLKNGTYTLNSVGIVAGDTTDGANVHVRIMGESRNSTIIKSGSGFPQLLYQVCDLDVENITFDGNSVATISGISEDSSIVPSKKLKVTNCKFTNIEGFDIILGKNQGNSGISTPI